MNIRSIFRRKREAETWAAGDLAECVVQTTWYRRSGVASSHPGPVKGERYAVRRVCQDDEGLVYLGFARFPGRSYVARAFRKVRPQADAAIAANAAWAGAVLSKPAVPAHAGAVS